MAIITQSQIDDFASIFSGHFDIFGYHTLVVWKEPKKIISESPGPSYPGYDNTSVIQTITYQQVSGSFPALRVKDGDPRWKEFDQTRQQITKAQLRIKVKPDCRDYIMNGKTELVHYDGLPCNIVSDDAGQNYFGQQYHYFTLERTN
jgi:hypothetical protein